MANARHWTALNVAQSQIICARSLTMVPHSQDKQIVGKFELRGDGKARLLAACLVDHGLGWD